MARFVGAFFARLHAMQVPPHHPKCHEIDLAASVPGWIRLPAAEEWIKKAALDNGERPQDARNYGAVTQQTYFSNRWIVPVQCDDIEGTP